MCKLDPSLLFSAHFSAENRAPQNQDDIYDSVKLKYYGKMYATRKFCQQKTSCLGSHMQVCKQQNKDTSASHFCKHSYRVVSMSQSLHTLGISPMYWSIRHNPNLSTTQYLVNTSQSPYDDKKFSIILEGSCGAAPCGDQALLVVGMTLQGSRTTAELDLQRIEVVGYREKCQKFLLCILCQRNLDLFIHDQ